MTDMEICLIKGKFMRLHPRLRNTLAIVYLREQQFGGNVLSDTLFDHVVHRWS